VFTRAVPSNLSLQISLEKVIILGKIPSLCCLNLENRDVLYKDKIENYACKPPKEWHANYPEAHYQVIHRENYLPFI
jgi:hypothetical protein